MSFVVFAMPRSRTAWLSQWLSRASGGVVGHDTAIWCDTTDQWLDAIWRGLAGTVETGAAEAWPILRRAMPACRIVVISRPLDEVEHALCRAGFPAPPDVLRARATALRDLSEQPGVVTIPYAELDEPSNAVALHEHCLGARMYEPLWQHMLGVRVTVDRERRLGALAERAPAIAALKAERDERLACWRPWICIGEEPWHAVADAVVGLAKTHHAEAAREGPYQPNRALLDAWASQGMLRVFTARVDSEMAGYCMWSPEVNAEAMVPPTMVQGPYYVCPQYAQHRLGARLLEVSRKALAWQGIRRLRLHHTMWGRGVKAGALYQRMGATEYQREYLLEIGNA